MFKFARNKLVGVTRESADNLSVHGVLEDDIYAVELTLKINITDHIISGVAGRWKRWTTPECPRALDFLKEAEGLKIDENTHQTIHKVIGRKACRHFANLMIECIYAAGEATRALQWEEAKTRQPDLTLRDFLAAGKDQAAIGISPAKPIQKDGKQTVSLATADAETPAPGVAGVQPQGEAGTVAASSRDGFFMDLHVHSFPASPCSSTGLEELIHEAKRIGLDGFCLTDHNHVWPASEVHQIAQNHQFLILRGNEITTDQGDVIVFGFHRDIKGIVKLEALRKEVLEAGGFIIVAHPFRGFLTFGAGELGLTSQKAMERPLFQWVDAVEVLNGKVTEKENRLAQEVAASLNLPTTGGSDAHEVGEVGRYATRFPRPLHTEEDLLAALKSGNYEPVAFRKERM